MKRPVHVQVLCNTGCSLETVKNYLLMNRATKQPVSWDRCLFVHQICTFWYLVSKKFNTYTVIIHLWRLWRCKTVDVYKIHWKLMILKSQFHCMCTRLCLVRACECIFLIQKCCGRSSLTYELKFKFHNDPGLHCGDICKSLLTFKISNF